MNSGGVSFVELNRIQWDIIILDNKSDNSEFLTIQLPSKD